MSVLKSIKFGNVSTPIAQTVVTNATGGVMTVSGSNTRSTDNADPSYAIDVNADGLTLVKDNGTLKTALKIVYEAAGGEGAAAHGARIALVDQNGASGYNVVASVPVSSIVGGGIVTSTSYSETTGELTITWDGGQTTVINLGALLDIDDVSIKTGSTDFLEVTLSGSASETGGGQAQFGVKLADVTYSAASGNTPANLTVDTTNGKVLDASDAIPAIKSYVDAKITAASSVTAQGDNYITAAQDAQDSMKINVSADVQSLTATAGTPGTYGADGSQTTAPTAGTLSGTADSLADGADIATKVKTYVDGAIAIEGARSDAKNTADIKAAIEALDLTTDTAVAGQYVAAIQEADGVVSVKTRANVADAVLTGYAKGSAPAAGSEAVAATDDVKGAIAKLEHQVDAAKSAASAAHSIVAEDSGNTHVSVTASQPDATTGAITYTIGEDDIASAQGLSTEVTRAQNAEGEIATQLGLTGNEGARAWTPTTNYGTSGDSVQDNMEAIDSQVKTNADNIATLQSSVGDISYEVNGTELIFYGIPAHQSGN